jgi:peptidoglycan hydrolase-like protein with peptidoglycan-binding domain
MTRLVPPSTARRPTLLLSAVVALLAGLLTMLTTAAAPADAAAVRVPSLPAQTGLPAGIEPLAQYVGQVSCQNPYRAGTLKLGRLLVATYSNTSFGGSYACGTDGGRSEHYDGRAVDWMNSVRNARQAAQAASVLTFLLGTDRAGNTFANARRMGVMYLIWNNRIWGAWDGRWAPYGNCARTPSPGLDSSCHRNHMHISLSWDGAAGRTSYWTRHVFSAVDFGPCRVNGMNWASKYIAFNPRPCPAVRATPVPNTASPTYRALARYSGILMGRGYTGPAARPVQLAMSVPQTGVLDVRTLTNVNIFKRAHRLPADGRVDTATWRVLLARFYPR